MTWSIASGQGNRKAGNGMKIISRLIAAGGNPATPGTRASRSLSGLRRPARTIAAAAAVGAAVAAATLAIPAYAATTGAFHGVSSSSPSVDVAASNGEIVIGSTASNGDIVIGSTASNGDVVIGTA